MEIHPAPNHPSRPPPQIRVKIGVQLWYHQIMNVVHHRYLCALACQKTYEQALEVMRVNHVHRFAPGEPQQLAGQYKVQEWFI